MVQIPPRPWPTGTPEHPEPLVTRVLAPNPSPYTFTGTQTYLVGSGKDRAVIDPGPNDPEHLAAILAAAGDATITTILCTHTHRDHSPAAAPLAEATGAPIMGCAKLVIADNGPRADEAFDTTYEPVRVLEDGEEVSGEGWTLRAVHTPGHTSGGVCLYLDGTLVSGDTLFPGGPGRTRSHADFLRVVDSITTHLYVLPDGTLVLPGHGADTTIANSKREYAIFAAKQHDADLHNHVSWLDS